MRCAEARGQRLSARAALLLGLPLGAALAACAPAEKINVDPDTTIAWGDAGVGGTVTEAAVARCGEGAIECGTPARGSDAPGCCPQGNICTPEKTCAPRTNCTSNKDCSSDTLCGGSTCTPWSGLAVVNRGFDLSCRDGVDLPSLKPQVQCSWPGNTTPSDHPESVQVIGTPMVIDFDFDNDPTTHRPSIVFLSYESLDKPGGVLRVIDGRTCQLQFSAAGTPPLMQDISPALGDVDGDKRPDIVVADLSTLGTATTAGLVVYKYDSGTSFKVLARQTGSSTTEFSRISLADIDGLSDGLPEIVTDTGLYSVKVGGSGSLSGIVEKKPLQAQNLREPPVVRDVDGNRTAEIITTNGIFNWNEDLQDLEVTEARGDALWNTPGGSADPSLAFIGMANLGEYDRNALQRDSVEMVTVGAGKLLVTQVDGDVLLNVQGSGIVGGPPVIADFDGDGRMEFASPGLDQFTAFDLDCVSGDADVKANPQNCKNPDGPNPDGILWKRTEGLHGATSGASLFDFDGDQRAEVVYADQCYMRIMDGLTGNVLFSVPRSSVTRFDYPVIADADGDGHTEIVTASNDAADMGCASTDISNQHETVNFRATHGVTVWADADKKWAGSRPIWNQYQYSINNVNDDGTVPQMNQVATQWNNPTQDPNSLRQNVQGATGVSLQLADLTVSASPLVQCPRGGFATLSANLCNRGLAPVAAGKVNVKMAPSSAMASTLCEVANKTQLASGKCEPVKCDVGVPTRASGFNVMVWAESGSDVPECGAGTQNSALISNVYCTGVIQ